MLNYNQLNKLNDIALSSFKLTLKIYVKTLDFINHIYFQYHLNFIKNIFTDK